MSWLLFRKFSNNTVLNPLFSCLLLTYRLLLTYLHIGDSVGGRQGARRVAAESGAGDTEPPGRFLSDQEFTRGHISGAESVVLILRRSGL